MIKSSSVNYKISRSPFSKGIIVTAETLFDLRNVSNNFEQFNSEEAKAGFDHLLNFLENTYRKTFPKAKIEL